jgi:hypothetical protein
VNQIESKSILAKCLATENISIVHDPKAPTAAFDVKARTLYLPLWKKMSPDLYDLFIGHEVGHAHETPAEGWHDAVCDDRAKKNFLNVVEDVRIERKIKDRYPGLVSSFYKGYKELIDGDFFGIKGIDINKLPLIDRVNLHYKVGHMMGVVFKEEEKDLVGRIYKAETWEDVERLANELFVANQKDMEDKEEELESMIDSMMPQRFKMDPDGEELEPGDQEMEMEPMDSNDVGGQESDSFGDVGDPDDDEDERDEAREEAKEAERERKEKEDYEKWLDQSPEERQADEDAKRELAEQKREDQKLKEKLDDLKEALDSGESFTDNAFRSNEKSLVDQDQASLIYVKAPKIDVKDFIVPMDELYDWENSIELTGTNVNNKGRYGEKVYSNTEVYGIATKAYEKWNRTNAPIINSMAQQFELRKAAVAYKKTSIAKTGKLNEDKLWAYKLTEDLFQRSLIVPDGKNHGILMFVDLSGSMYKNMSGTVDQMMTVAAFCRKVNIPFDVYGFSTAGNKGKSSEDFADHWYTKQREALPTMEEGQMLVDCSNFCLVHMLSSLCSRDQYQNAMKYLNIIKCGWDHRRYYSDYGDNEYWGYIKNRHFSLGSTPLNSCIIVGKEVAKIFRKKYNVEILSTIFLTDGGATDNLAYATTIDYKGDPKESHSRSIYDEKVAIVDGSATIVLDANSGQNKYARHDVATSTLLEWYQQTTGSRMINFHIIDGKKSAFWTEWNKNVWMDGIDEDTYYVSHEWSANEWKDCLKNKFMLVEDKYGFDQRFLIRGADDLKIEDKELSVKSNKKGDLMRGFRAFNKGKTSQRLFLNKIIELVA